MQAQFRADYPGEFVVLETKWSGGRKQQQREWVANPIENNHISGRAACIGTNMDRHKFDYTRLQKHRGGLLGSKKLQTYGVGRIASEMTLDFCVETRKDCLPSMIENKYCENNVVYTTAKNCIAYPENFYLIPLNPRLLDLANIVYLAAFDGHHEIFLLGYNKDVQIERTNWYEEILKVINAYSNAKFYFVGESTNMYEQWLDCANAESMTYREFITYCDI